ncbi:MAG: PadR family transcriptional regulator [Jiangellaceae bacterium]
MTAPSIPFPDGFGWSPYQRQNKSAPDRRRAARRDAAAQMSAGSGRDRPRRHGGRGRGRGPRPEGGGSPYGDFGPGDFGPGPSPFSGLRHRGPRGRRRGRGDVRAAILVLIAETPMHGYQLIQEISEHSGGTWRPSPGSVYPALQLLEDQGLIRFETADGRRVVHLTEDGRQHVDENRADLDRVWDAFAGSHTGKVVEMRELMMQVGMAAMQVFRAGTPAQRDRAREILASTRRDLYAILAEPDEPEPGTDTPDAG